MCNKLKETEAYKELETICLLYPCLAKRSYTCERRVLRAISEAIQTLLQTTNILTPRDLPVVSVPEGRVRVSLVPVCHDTQQRTEKKI